MPNLRQAVEGSVQGRNGFFDTPEMELQWNNSLLNIAAIGKRGKVLNAGFYALNLEQAIDLFANFLRKQGYTVYLTPEEEDEDV